MTTLVLISLLKSELDTLNRRTLSNPHNKRAVHVVHARQWLDGMSLNKHLQYSKRSRLRLLEQWNFVEWPFIELNRIGKHK